MVLTNKSILIDRYKIIDVLGQGGMGAVYRAEDQNLGIVVAVKENLFTTEEYARQFRREANILASLRHPNLPRVFDHFEIKDVGQYLVMDYIVGEDLRQRMDRVGVMDEETVIISGAAICDALFYLHTRKPVILHRDLKPGNIKIDPEGQSYLVDFGLAKIVMGSEATTFGARAMTPGFSSPEQYGNARTDPRSDIYSLGATLYAALSGTIPEDGLARAMEQADLSPLRRNGNKISRKLATVIEKALEIHPEDRFQTAEDLKLALLSSRVSTRGLKNVEELTILPPPEDIMVSIELGERRKVASSAVTEVEMSAESGKRKRKKSRAKTIQNILNVLILLIGGSLIWFSAGFPGLENTAFYSFLQNNGGLNFIDRTDTHAEMLFTPTHDILQIVDATNIPNTEIPIASPTFIGPTDTLISPTDTSVSPSVTPIPSLSPTEIFGTLVPAGPTQNPNMPDYNEGIVYASFRSGETQIWHFNFLSDSSVQVFHFDGGACQPAWSPSGLKIAFISPCRENQDFYLGTSIYTFDLETNIIENLDLGDNVFDPEWSLDGTMMLYTKALTGTSMQIKRIDFKTGVIENMTDFEKINFQADWSNDGNRIVFSSSKSGGFHLYIMPNNPNGELEILSRGGGFNLDPVWLGNNFILFSKKSVDGPFYITTRVSLEMLGIDPVNYLDYAIDLGVESLPSQGIDINSSMDWITFESWPDGVHHNIYISRTDGTEKVQLTLDQYYDFDPAWKP